MYVIDNVQGVAVGHGVNSKLRPLCQNVIVFILSTLIAKGDSS